MVKSHKSMSNSDIEEQLSELYGFIVSTSTISIVTDKISTNIIAWQNGPLESTYLVVWMDAIVLPSYYVIGDFVSNNGYC